MQSFRSFFTRNIDGIIALLYTLALYFLWQLCQVGGVAVHVKRIVPLAVLLALCLGWRWVQRRKGRMAKRSWKSRGILLAVTLLFGGLIVHSAIPYHGHLSWVLDDFFHHKKVIYQHNNLFDDGLQGLLTDLGETQELPSDLYIREDLMIRFQSDGTIMGLETFLYGRSAKGDLRTFLLSYDAERGETLDVWLDGEAAPDFAPEKRLAPLLASLQKPTERALLFSTAQRLENGEFVWVYRGEEVVK